MKVLSLKSIDLSKLFSLSLIAFLIGFLLAGCATRSTVRKAEEQKLAACESWVAKGISLSKKGLNEEAGDCFAKALAIDPPYLPALHGKGAALLRLGETKAALKYLAKALKLDPQSPPALFSKGIALKNLGNFEESLNCFKKVREVCDLSEKQTGADAWYESGLIMSLQRKYPEALACFDRAILEATDDAFWDARLEKGIALNGLGKYREALEEYDEILARQPADSQTWYEKGATLSNLGRLKEAISCFNRALALNSNEVTAWFAKGQILEKLGQAKEAKVCYQRLVTAKPGAFEPAGLAYARLEEGLALEKQGRLKEAKECYGKAVRIEIPIINQWYYKGYALAKLGRSEEAILLLQTVKELADQYCWADLLGVGEKAERLRESLKKG